MSANALRPPVPTGRGQLVWCPSNPGLGVGLVVDTAQGALAVRFYSLEETRHYTTRGPDAPLLRYEIEAGTSVRRKDAGQVRIVRRLAAGPAPWIYESDDGQEIPEGELIPEVQDVGAKQRLATLHLAHPEIVRARIDGLELRSFLPQGALSVLGSRVLWLPHQLDVATQALRRDPIRLLLADEVGLGKTVEAALIYSGLRHEGRAARVLILTPQALCIQWLGEIYRKTHELLVLLDDERFDDTLRDFPGLNPFFAHQRIVASLPFLAENELVCEWALESTWDLVIVDEAHHLRRHQGQQGAPNAAYRLMEKLSGATRHLLLLTATPMALDPAEYQSLLRLLDPVRFDDPNRYTEMTETLRSLRQAALDVSQSIKDKKAIPPKLRTTMLGVLADDPQDSQKLERFWAAAPTAKTRGALAEPVLAALAERHALAEFVVRNRRGPVGGLPDRKPEVFPLKQTSLQSTLIEIGEDVVFELARSFEERALARAHLGTLLRALWAAPGALLPIAEEVSAELAQGLREPVERVLQAPLDREGLPTGDARLRWLVQYLQAQDEEDKVLVFVEGQIAAAALHSALRQWLGDRVAIFHRQLAPRDQDRQVAWFRDPKGPRLMVSTEAGGEGRNFQFCHRLVLYDLPWRPATIEQRIGRIDRVGQKRDVIVAVPYFDGSYEAAILKVMHESIGVLSHTVGGIDHELEYVSDQVADLILDGADSKAWKALYKKTHDLITRAREQIARDEDPILDHASFSPTRAQALLDQVPKELEHDLERFMMLYAEHTQVEIVSKGEGLVAVDPAPSAGGQEAASFVATFRRERAVDQEDVEFLSYGHPFVEQALAWCHESLEEAAGLAICRGFEREGAVFIWCFKLQWPEDRPELGSYLPVQQLLLAVDERGTEHPELLAKLMSPLRRLERMDVKPLQARQQQWSATVDQVYTLARDLAGKRVGDLSGQVANRLEAGHAERMRHVARARRRAVASGESLAALEAENARLLQRHESLLQAAELLVPKPVAVIAVRLVKGSSASA